MDNQELYPAGYEQEKKAFLEQMESCLDRNEPQAALDLARERLKQRPGDPDALVGICRARIMEGRIDKAGEMLEEAEEIVANLSRIYAFMGDVCIKKGMEDAAEEFYRRSMILNPGAHWARDIIRRLNGVEEPQGTDAEAKAEEGAEIPPDFRTPTLAELFIRQGHLRPAEELLEKIVEQEPQNEKASRLLEEVRDRMRAQAAEKRNAALIAELSRWLNQMDRVRGHVA
jgi:tetratricopeptide (TPR) repeat protein